MLRNRCSVTLHVAREEPHNSWNYERLENVVAQNVPDLLEIGYEISKERFVERKRSGRPSVGKIEDIGRRFFEEVVAKHFRT